MCQSVVALMSAAINPVDNADVLLKITGVVSLFIQTMDVRISTIDGEAERS